MVNPADPEPEFMEKTIRRPGEAVTCSKRSTSKSTPPTPRPRPTASSVRDSPAQGKFYNNRGTRLNYYAVTGAAGPRLPLGPEDRRCALTYAQEIIDLVTAKTLKFSTRDRS